MEFKKATIVAVKDTADADPPDDGTPVEVQINPATLRLQMASTVDFGKDAGRSKVSYQGSTSTLSFDLVFDTADEGRTEAPLDVRARTSVLEKFVLPQMKKAKSVPPRVRFTYGTLSVVGAMTGLNQDFDLFARNGVPLRAKCAVTIKVQRPEFDANLVGSGANTGAGAVTPIPPDAAGPGAGRGTGAGAPLPAPPPPPPDRTGTALAGESASDFANRMGLDPRAWKDLQGITDPLRLPAGLQVDFPSAVSAGFGLGVTAGLDVTVGGTAVAAAPPPVPGRPAAAPADGTALAAAGGLTRALDRAAVASAGATAAAARAAFTPGTRDGAPPGPATAVPTRARSAGAGPGGGAVPPADPRATGFGFGVPLRPRIGVGHTVATALVRVRGRATVRESTAADRPPETDDPTVAGWTALPVGPVAASARSGRAGGSGRACGCGGAA
jgi:hypothetical protein